MHLTLGMRPLWTGAQARSVDSLSSDRYGIASLDLMEQAGRALFETCLELRRPYHRFLILAGPGNNGGDALVAARLLHEAGYAPLVWSIVAPKSQESAHRSRQRAFCEELGISLFSTPTPPCSQAEEIFVVDGVLGLGLKDALRPGYYADALTAVAKLNPSLVLAVDFPSGLLADDWRQVEVPLPAHYTLSFGSAKLVHRLSPGRELCGQVILRSIGFAPEAIRDSLDVGPRCYESPNLATYIKPWQKLSLSAHKYTRGHGLVVGGSLGKIGASYLAAEGALRSGAGWISLAPLSDQLAPARIPTLTYEDWALLGSIEEDALERFVLQRKVRGILIGPGCMESPLTASLMLRLSRLNLEHKVFLVFDAGALKNWRSIAVGLRFDPDRTLLTPHPGEWRAMDEKLPALDTLVSLADAWDFCRSFGVTIFYKSASPFSLWTEGEQNFMCTHGDADHRLARAGSGDLLAGVCLTLGMQGIPAPTAGPLAQSILAQACDQASANQSPHGLTAKNLLPYLCP